MEERGRITKLIGEWRAGHQHAQAEIFDLLYDELHSIAHRQRRHLDAHTTLNTTALIHEVYLKFDRAGELAVNDRSHFLLVASRAMRQLLINYTRDMKRLKRGGAAQRVTLGPEAEREAIVEEQGTRLLDIDRALARLESLDEHLGQVTELLIFGGLTYDEAAEVLGVGRATVSRAWKVARALLVKELDELRERGEPG